MQVSVESSIFMSYEDITFGVRWKISLQKLASLIYLYNNTRKIYFNYDILLCHEKCLFHFLLTHTCILNKYKYKYSTDIYIYWANIIHL